MTTNACSASIINDIPDFSGALEQFRWFLAENGYPIEICWVFREDVWKLSAAEIVIKDKSDSENLALVQKVFADGHQTASWNFAELTARIFATILDQQLVLRDGRTKQGQFDNKIKAAMCDGTHKL